MGRVVFDAIAPAPTDEQSWYFAILRKIGFGQACCNLGILEEIGGVDLLLNHPSVFATFNFHQCFVISLL